MFFLRDLRRLPESSMKRFSAVISTSLLVLVGPCWGHADRVDDYVREQMQTWHIPGVSIGVVRDGKVLLAKGYGFANIELGARATADTVYEILSITKQFTAAAILVLVEEGKTGLDDTVAKYLPDSPTSWKDVTVRHLLTHSSGIMDFTDIPPFFEQLRLDATPDELLKAVKKRPLQFSPGTQWRYSNSNYYLLGQIIEKLSGVTERIASIKDRVSVRNQKTKSQVRVVPCRTFSSREDGPKKELGTGNFFTY